MARFLDIIKSRLASASSVALDVGVEADTQIRLQVDSGGKMTWGSGSASGDTTLYRSAADTLTTDDVFNALAGLVTLTTAGAPTQALANGAIAIDTTNHVFYFRSNSAWNEVSGGASVSVSSTAPVGPEAGNLWFNQDTAQTFIYYDSQWVEVGASGMAMISSTTAPASPITGLLWFKSDTAQSFVYYDLQWIEIGASGMAAVVSATAPASPISGLLWYNSDTGGTYVYYGTIWVEVGAAPFNYIMNTINAKGDLLVGSADNAITGVTVGTNGQVLTAASGEASGVAWATPTVYAAINSPTFTGTVTIPTPYTIGAVSMTATGTELNHTVGVTSAIQTQLDAKATTGRAVAMALVFGGG